MRSSGPRRDLLEVLGVLAALLATLSALASGNALDDDTEWDAVSEFPGAERQGAILQALSLGLNFTNVSRNDCVWRKLQESHDPCPGEDVTVHLYTSTNESRLVNVSEANSLLQGDWDAQKHTIVLVHGYGGGHDTLPMSILRDAYLLAGGYNVLVVDWSPLARLPCYPAAVHNSAVAARCVGGVARLLRDSGARGDAWTCVGHSLGAHVCGIMADTVMFRVHKIIGLDPARPLIRPQNKHRLDAGDASVVHVMHTNAGHYGELGAIGTADFCVNGGRAQPFCSAAKNPNLCSHLSSICFLADSIDGQSPMAAEPCGRRCPSARRHQSEHKQRLGLGLPSSLGQHTPDSASGTFCASSDAEPYCQREPGGRGHPRCCPPRHQTAPAPTPTASTASTTAASDAAREDAATTATTALSTAGPSTASTVGSTLGTEAATAAPATTTQSSFKVGAALPVLPTTTSTTTTTPAPQPGFSPVTSPMRADKVTLPDEVSLQDGDRVADTTQQVAAPTTALPSLPVTFPTPAAPASAPGPAQTPAVDDIPVVMMPPPMPLPDWKPVVFVEDTTEAVRPQEPLLAPLRPQPQPQPASLPWDIPLAGPASAQDGEAPGKWTPPQPQPITPQRWTPPPIRVPSEPVAPAAPAVPAAPIRWPTAMPPGVHIVMPSNDTSLYEEPVTEEGPVIAIYSTKSPLGPPPPPSPLVVVTANSEAHHVHPQQHKQPVQPQHQHDIRDNLIEPSTAFAEVTLSPAGLSNTNSIDQEMVAMMEMSPPPPEPLVVGGFPSPSPPPPEPAVPEEPGLIPAAGSPTGAWLPLVMMPPTPFSVDSWALRYKDRLPRPTAVRRTSYRKRVYD